MAIVKPEAMSFKDKNVIIILSGLPGTGKTTLALSAPDVLLIDCDEGMARVNPAHRKDASICKTFEEIRQDVEAAKGHYKTVAIDTGGALVDMLKQHVIDHPKDYPSGAKKAGGISLQGFGVVKQLFLDFSADLRRNFNVVFIFHENKTRNDDDGIFYELVCEGSARTLVYQPADLAAHLFIQNGARKLGFTPTEQYSAKSAYGIKDIIEVPELKEGDKNDFLTKLFARVRENLQAETESYGAEKKQYDEVMAAVKEYCGYITEPGKVSEVMDMVRKLPHVLTSEKEAKAMIKRRLDELDIAWNKAEKKYEYRQKPEA